MSTQMATQISCWWELHCIISFWRRKKAGSTSTWWLIRWAVINGYDYVMVSSLLWRSTICWFTMINCFGCTYDHPREPVCEVTVTKIYLIFIVYVNILLLFFSTDGIEIWPASVRTIHGEIWFHHIQSCRFKWRSTQRCSCWSPPWEW